jgi:hypothetical protein
VDTNRDDIGKWRGVGFAFEHYSTLFLLFFFFFFFFHFVQRAFLGISFLLFFYLRLHGWGWSFLPVINGTDVSFFFLGVGLQLNVDLLLFRPHFAKPKI